MLRRLPLRLRVTAAFAAVTAVVLAATGLFTYLRFSTELDKTVNTGLHARVGDIRALLRQTRGRLPSTGHSLLIAKGERLAQILEPSGLVLDSTPELAGGQLTPGQLAGARRHSVLVEHEHGPQGAPVRLLAAPVHAHHRRVIAVVGTSLEERRDAQRDLGALLLVGGPAGLLLAALAGYGVAAAGLAPVESMRRRAAAIEAGDPGNRLPVPPSNDELARLGTTLNTMLDRLEAAFARERAFVADASHELRTPLAVLKTQLEVARLRPRSNEELLETIREAEQQTDRLAHLAEDLLVIARADQGQLPVNPAPVPVAQLFADLRVRYEKRAAEAGAHIDAEAVDGLRLQADPVRVEQALGNLVDNALRHGGPAVRLTANDTPGHVELHVLDDGGGFPPGFTETAFERFTQADSARSGGGAGLGLAIVELIAQAHGGTAGAVNRPEGGADVWLRLPAAPRE